MFCFKTRGCNTNLVFLHNQTVCTDFSQQLWRKPAYMTQCNLCMEQFYKSKRIIKKAMHLWNKVPSILTFSTNWRLDALSSASNLSRMSLFCCCQRTKIRCFSMEPAGSQRAALYCNIHSDQYSNKTLVSKEEKSHLTNDDRHKLETEANAIYWKMLSSIISL